MVLSLSQQEADAKISQIEGARDQAVEKLKTIDQTQQDMLASAWKGNASAVYSRNSVQQHEEFQTLINTLNGIVDKGKEHIKSITHGDG